MSMAGVILMYNGVRRGGRPTLGLLVTWTAAASILATIALTIYLITKDAELNVQWWSYLIQALVGGVGVRPCRTCEASAAAALPCTHTSYG